MHIKESICIIYFELLKVQWNLFYPDGVGQQSAHN